MKLRHLLLAKQLALKSKHKHKLGAVIAQGNRLISLGFNQLKTHPKSTHPYHTLHAEMDAIFSCPPNSLIGSQLYVFRLTKGGVAALAKPCIYCESVIKKVGIKKVYYTISEGSYGTTII